MDFLAAALSASCSSRSSSSVGVVVEAFLEGLKFLTTVFVLAVADSESPRGRGGRWEVERISYVSERREGSGGGGRVCNFEVDELGCGM